MANSNENKPRGSGSQGQQPHRGGPVDTQQQERDRATEEARKKRGQGPDGGAAKEKRPGGVALDINGPAGGDGKAEQRELAARREDR